MPLKRSRGAPCRGAPWFFCFFRGGYTLIETLTAILITGILAGSFSVIYSHMTAGSPEKEAQLLARWLTNLTTISNRTGRSFSLHCPGNEKVNFIEATWRDTSEKDTYTSAYGCGFKRYIEDKPGLYYGTFADSLYTPQWTALVPTITVRVSRGDTEHYVIVSRQGRVRTHKLPVIDR